MRRCLKGLMLFSFVLAFNSRAQEANGNSVLAKINDRTITLNEFNKRFEQNSQLVPGKAPPKAEVLKNIIAFELATQEARRL